MKKFITSIPHQNIGGLKASIYHSVGNKNLVLDKEISFPILSIINGYTKENEEIEILALASDNKNVKMNLEIFKEQLKSLCEDKNIKYRVTEILMPNNEDTNTHLETFQKIIEKIEDDDILHACITFGTKPIALIEMMALNYAYRVKNNTTVKCVAYGLIDHDTNESKIYDMTVLFLMDNIINKLADMKVDNPSDTIKKILGL